MGLLLKVTAHQCSKCIGLSLKHLQQNLNEHLEFLTLLTSSFLSVLPVSILKTEGAKKKLEKTSYEQYNLINNKKSNKIMRKKLTKKTLKRI